MTEVRRIGAAETRQRVRSGRTLLVCAYPTDPAFRKWPLDGAISLPELRRRTPSIPADTPLVFYCNCPRDNTAADRAADAVQAGFTDVAVLHDGVSAWLDAGFPMKED